MKTALFASVLGAALTLGCANTTALAPHAAPAAMAMAMDAPDRPATHGMLVIGSGRIYLSHLPMFHAPHDYQVIVEAGFDARSAAVYAADRAKTHGTLYTLVPQPFVLPQVVSHKTPFEATLFRGHFERGGTAIAARVHVQIKQVLLFKKFVPGAAKPSELNYFLFGQGTQAYAAHEIVAPPDYDQVLAVHVDAPVPAQGESITIRNGRDAQPLQTGAHVTALAPGAALQIDVAQTLYDETGDLAD